MRPWLEHDAVLEARRRLAHPSRPETRRQGKDRRQAQEARVQTPHNLGRPDRLGLGAPERGGRRHRRRSSGAAPPGQAAHRPARSAGRCRRPGRGPSGGPPSLPGPDHTCPGSWVPAAAVLAGRDPGQGPPGTGAQLASYAGLAPVTRRSGSSIRGEARLPRRQQEAQARHVPLRLRLPALRPRLPGLLPTQTKPGQTALGRAHPRPGPPPHPDPARHDPRWSPLRPTTSHETTRRRLTHHIRAPPPVAARDRTVNRL